VKNFGNKHIAAFLAVSFVMFLFNSAINERLMGNASYQTD
jgi:hypothetical protein